ncbi:MAG TPA: SGNH/GDSL hydrolase family protein, partial [Burkholderiaceae bacterium]
AVAGTLPPFEDALAGTPLAAYSRPAAKDALRRRVNDWLRATDVFDAVVDFDAVLRDPAHPARLAPAFDSGDHLHPGDRGNAAMADAVDLGALLAGQAVECTATPSRLRITSAAQSARCSNTSSPR